MLDDDVLTFTTESAWDRCHEVENLIMEKYPSLSIAFRVEESGMAIYQKNDCHFFPEEYLIDIEDDDVYYCTEEQALQKLSDFFGIDFKDVSEATGVFSLSEHIKYGAIIRGMKDFSLGEEWNHIYAITKLTRDTMEWTALDETGLSTTNISVYMRIK